MENFAFKYFENLHAKINPQKRSAATPDLKTMRVNQEIYQDFLFIFVFLSILNKLPVVLLNKFYVQ